MVSTKEAALSMRTKSASSNKFIVTLRVLMAGLVVMYVTGVAMVALGEPDEHTASSAANFWHALFGIHMIGLLALVIAAILVAVTAFTSQHDLRGRAVVGIVVIIIASTAGDLSVQHIQASWTLFIVGLSVLFIGAIYGPLLAQPKKA
ncbi:MAG: hypothetical protein JWO07_245 [Candidatus Saccharibacteria bacterium]|nr:hypothetical protein [Candidatus Saccharibacteria bacterium]